MSQPHFQPSSKHLFSAIKERKVKQFRPYVKDIEDQVEKTQKIVANLLHQILVQKKFKDPVIMFNAMILYKQLLISATMDYICVEDVFPKAINLELQNIVGYMPNQREIKVKGITYFKDTLGVQINQDTKLYGYNYILFASQLLTAMANWYPTEYDDVQATSIFKQMYEKLVKKGVVLPEQKQFQFLKESDKVSFKKNYASFLSYQKEYEGKVEAQQKYQPMKIKKPEVQHPHPKAQTKGISNDIKRKQGQKPGNTLNITNSTLVNIPAANLSSKVAGIQSSKTSILGSNAVSSRQQRAQLQDMIILTKPLVDKEPQTAGCTMNSFNPSPEDLRQMEKWQHIKSKVIPRRIDYIPERIQANRQDSSGGNAMKEDAHESFGDMSLGSESLRLSSLKNKKSAKRPSAQTNNIPRSPQYQINDSPIVTVSFGPAQIQKQISFGVPEPYHQPNQFETPKKGSPPKKIPKNEKPHVASFTTSPQLSPQRIGRYQGTTNRLNNGQSQGKSNKPRSLPKTENKKWRQFPTAFKHANKHQQKNLLVQPLDLYPAISHEYKQNKDHHRDLFNKTLSYFAQTRRKLSQPITQLERFNNLATIIQRMRLDRTTLPYHADYFEPLTSSMASLREQALILYNSGSNSNPFYFSKTIQARLVKQGNHTYLLSLHNIANEEISVDYVSMVNMKYSKRVKIISWGNQAEINCVKLAKHGYFDIKFTFQVYDLNYKFLPFSILINDQPQNLVLPITLLDICDITNHIDLKQLEKYSLKGSTIVSEPFILRSQGLPHFLGNYKFNQVSARKQQSLVIGQCTLSMQSTNRNETNPTTVHIIVKMLDNSSRSCVIETIYLTKDGQALDLAKVAMYLLLFLLLEAK